MSEFLEIQYVHVRNNNQFLRVLCVLDKQDYFYCVKQLGCQNRENWDLFGMDQVLLITNISIISH